MNKKIRNILFLFIITALITRGLTFLLSDGSVLAPPDPGWLTGWSYRKSHVINSASGAGTNYQVKIVVYKSTGTDSGQDVYVGTNVRDDFGDVRFTDDDGTTLLDYWIEEKTDSDYAVLWVKVADDLSSSDQTIYIYYGNPDATTTSNRDNTFLFFDDFSRPVKEITQTFALSPRVIQLANGNLLMSLSDYSDGYKVYKSINNGDSWTLLSTPWTGLSQCGENDIIQLSDGTVIILRTYTGTGNTYLKKSTDNGATWGSEIEIDTGSSSSDIIELSDGNLLLAQCASGIISVRKSTHGGNTWQPAVTVFSADESSGTWEDPKLIQLPNGDILCVAEDEVNEGGYSKIKQKRSTDGGANWGTATTIIDPTSDVDNEIAGYLQYSSSELRLYFTNDEHDPDYGSYSHANLMCLTTDNGTNWGNKRTACEISITGGGGNGDPIKLANGDIYVYFQQRSTWSDSSYSRTWWAKDDGQDHTPKWSQFVGQRKISDGILVLSEDNLEAKILSSETAIQYNYAWRAKWKASTTDAYGRQVGNGNNIAGTEYYPSNGLHWQFHGGTGDGRCNAKWIKDDVKYEEINLDTPGTSFHITEIRRISGKVYYLYDGLTLHTQTENLPTTSVKTWVRARYEGEFDWVLVRKYVDPEPAHGTWGSEEPTTVSGNAYEDETSTALVACDGTTNMIALRVGGTTYGPVSCADADGAFTISYVDPPSAGTPMVIWIDGVTDNFGSNINRYSGSGDVTNIAVRRNRVIVQHDDAGPITNANMDTWDNDNDTDINYVVDASDNLTVEAGSKLIINTNDTFTPGGNVTTPAMRIIGTYNAGSYILILNTGGTSTTCTDAVGTIIPL